jgi:hypothetical protein
MVGAAGRVGYRISMAPPVVLAGMVPPPEVMRRLPTGTALYIAMMSLGHEGPSYRLGKTLATMRRRLEELWAKATRSKA